MPFVASLIERELGKAMSDTEKELAAQMEGMDYHRRIPEKGWGRNRVVEEINKMMQLGRIIGFKMLVFVSSAKCN